MSNPRLITIFKPDVSEDKVKEYAKEFEENGATGIKFLTPLLNGFSSVVPESYLEQFKSFQGDVIDYIEPDGVVTTQ